MSATEETVRDAFAVQAQACSERGSPFMSALCMALRGTLDRSTEVGRRVLDWQGRPDARGDSVPLRLAAGLHALVRGGRLPSLATAYPPHSLPSEEDLGAVLSKALTMANADLLPWLESPPQTNEPVRSAPLMSGLVVIATRTGGLPFALYEVGASAGLMLVLDRYEHHLGGVVAGTPGAPVQIAPEWDGGQPPSGLPVKIVARRGCDLEPLDVTSPEDRERLLAYVWPDQADRLARIQAALDLAVADPPRVERAEAAAWAEAVLEPDAAEANVVRVLMHAVALQYAPEEVTRRIATQAARLGEAATEKTPFAWLRFEADPAYDEQGALRLTFWPGGEERVLAIGDTHGEKLRWLG